jgi:hypothetical protein
VSISPFSREAFFVLEVKVRIFIGAIALKKMLVKLTLGGGDDII